MNDLNALHRAREFKHVSNSEPAHFDPKDIAIRAIKIAKSYDHEMATLEHVLVALLEDKDVQACLTSLKVDVEHLSSNMTTFMVSDAIGKVMMDQVPQRSQMFEALFVRVVGAALFQGRRPTSALDILLALTQCSHEDSYAVTALLRYGVTQLAVKRYMAHGSPNVAGVKQMETAGGAAGPGEPEPQSTEEAVKYILKFCSDLNSLAKEGKIDPMIGRAAEVAQITQVLARRTKNNAIMVGDPGVGKTAIAEGLAYNIVHGKVPEVIAKSTVYSLDIGALVAGTRFRGDFEERMKMLLKALLMLDDTILFIDEIHTIMEAGSGSKGSLDVANLLKPALAKGSLRCIGSTTLEEYRKHFEKDRALVRRFKRVTIDEPSPEVTKLILRGLKNVYEAYHKVLFTEAALDAAVDLTVKYLHDAKLPDKAIDVLDNAGARQRVAPVNERLSVIDVKEIEAEVSLVAKIPVQQMAEDESDALANLETDLRRAVFGQDPALITLTDAVYVARAGLREPNKPEGSYLFVGPTGVGKTEVAKQLAKTRGVELVRFDMSEYMEKHSVSKLIGAPPGYVGYGEGGAGNGLLTNEIDSHPNCVLLLDEIEKAHIDIFNVLLQVMDEGHLTNSSGKRVSFRNVILIMTSNAGAMAADREPIGFNAAAVPDIDETAIKKFFAPEFRNRLDAVVHFDRLKPENMVRIVDKFLHGLSDLAASRHVQIKSDKKAREWLAKKGYDPLMGARPLARLINDSVKKPLARMMLTGPLKTGGTVALGVQDDAIVLSIVSTERKTPRKRRQEAEAA